MVKRKNIFNYLPNELKIKIYKFDNTYKQIFNIVLKELIYNYNKNLRNILYPHAFIIYLI